MMIEQVLTLLAIAMQSVGKVLYGTFLAGVPTPLFVLVSVCLTALVFLIVARFRLPQKGRGVLLLVNVWTAIGFISLFFALKYLPPAIFASIEIGSSLLAAIALTAVQTRAWPRIVRITACLGILVGCALLSWTELGASRSETAGALVWIAIAASTATGITSALTVVACKKLAASGWTSPAVLAHRFYLTIAVAAIWFPMTSSGVTVPAIGTLTLVAAVGAIGVLIPLLMLQIALRRTDELTVLICMAAQPILSFLLSLPSPAYDWNALTLFGVLVVTAFVGMDIAMRRKAGRGNIGSSGKPVLLDSNKV
jgi:drug/metabolite transporter (DMT)-like permease